jgi:predicted nucleotidyltransferase
MLTRSEVMDLLRSLKKEKAERYRVEELALFGSIARQEQGPKSDVDLLVDFAEGATLLDLVGLGMFLEEKLGCPVDLVPRRGLRREIRDEALNQVVPV